MNQTLYGNLGAGDFDEKTLPQSTEYKTITSFSYGYLKTMSQMESTSFKILTGAMRKMGGFVNDIPGMDCLNQENCT